MFLALVHLLLWVYLNTRGVNAKEDTTLLYWENIPELVYTKNQHEVPLSTFQSSLKVPNVSTETFFDGFDLTQPFPGTKLSGYKAHLRVAYDFPISDDQVDNSTTAITSITFGAPSSMIGKDGNIKPMDPSWQVCRTTFVSLLKNQTDAAKSDDTCNFLSPKCISDLKAELTENWMGVKWQTKFLCSVLPDHPIPKSCEEFFGKAVSEVRGMFLG
jgi:hypothetical protein